MIHGLIDNILKGFVVQDASMSFSRCHQDVAILKTLFDHNSMVGYKRLAYALTRFLIFK